MQRRGGTYYAAFRAHGRLIRKKLSRDFDAAVSILRDLRARADRADFGLTDNDHPWSELKAEFLRWKRQTSRNPEDYETDLKAFEAYQKVNSIREITPSWLMAFREWRLAQPIRKGHARLNLPRTVNKLVGTLKHMLNMGVEWKRIGSNAIADVAPLPHDCPFKVRRALTIEELLALFKESPEHLK